MRGGARVLRGAGRRARPAVAAALVAVTLPASPPLVKDDVSVSFDELPPHLAQVIGKKVVIPMQQGGGYGVVAASRAASARWRSKGDPEEFVTSYIDELVMADGTKLAAESGASSESEPEAEAPIRPPPKRASRATTRRRRLQPRRRASWTKIASSVSHLCEAAYRMAARGALVASPELVGRLARLVRLYKDDAGEGAAARALAQVVDAQTISDEGLLGTILDEAVLPHLARPCASVVLAALARAAVASNNRAALRPALAGRLIPLEDAAPTCDPIRVLLETASTIGFRPGYFDAPPEAPAAPQRAALLAWLHEHVSDEARRVFVLRACDGLDDLAAATDAEDVLSLDTWPALARARFLRALAALRGEEPADEEDEAAPPEVELDAESDAEEEAADAEEEEDDDDEEDEALAAALAASAVARGGGPAAAAGGRRGVAGRRRGDARARRRARRLRRGGGRRGALRGTAARAAAVVVAPARRRVGRARRGVGPGCPGPGGGGARSLGGFGRCRAAPIGG